MNFLILAAGTRNKIVQYFKESFAGTGNIIAADASALSPAIYEADRYYIVPSVTDSCYLDRVLDICREENIKGVLSLIDTDLSLLSSNKGRFEALGATVVGSPSELCDLSLNKYSMYQWLRDNGFNCARSWVDREEFYEAVEKGEVSYPVIVKPICGSASISVMKACDKSSVDFLFEHENDLMIQEFLNGTEIGADVYVDILSGETVSVFTKRKIKMRAGETDKSVSFKDDALFSLIDDFMTKAGFRGQIDIDIFDIDGKYYISEVNPRFGGGYPHAHECGCNHMELIKNNLYGKTNRKQIGEYKENIYMLKYNELIVKENLE